MADKVKRDRARRGRERKRQERKRKQAAVAPDQKSAAQWLRNKPLAARAGVSEMTLWRWKQQDDFPAAAVINGIEYNNVSKFDRWMWKHQASTEPRRPWLLESRNREVAT
jgi:hypothetical protein